MLPNQEAVPRHAILHTRLRPSHFLPAAEGCLPCHEARETHSNGLVVVVVIPLPGQCPTQQPTAGYSSVTTCTKRIHEEAKVSRSRTRQAVWTSYQIRHPSFTKSFTFTAIYRRHEISQILLVSALSALIAVEYFRFESWVQDSRGDSSGNSL
ncbi:hypothetical protein BGZ61DRAFT_204762 [Ilyonectria robusta]|uniref:uncharacterized protein n=1 Tax=Ilyonectria robusta TaxID=1079257 RepID=UPI001E8CFA1E|nr:uncharacterized protein BGZ61DRAFT_204762 [Ilyonectria robusta]KAH8654250.1 hypothetical protein BGZ61DRAFT_204762 [Ilyonectria robusta]